MTALVATAVDVAAVKPKVFVVSAVGGDILQLAVLVPLLGVPLQCRALLVPPHRLQQQATEIQFYLVAVFVRRSDDTALVGSVVLSFFHIGIVAAAHHLIIYI